VIEGEIKVIGQAWECQKAAGVDARPVQLQKYLDVVNAEMRVRRDLDPDEAGLCMKLGSRSIICVNGNHSLERQRFTALHEVAHLFLGMPSKHGNALTVEKLFRYSNKPREEILCDVFAAECLFPRQLFARDLARFSPGMQSIQTLAEEYEASLAATGSRFAAYSKDPCAWVLADDRRVRYVSQSPAMREASFWIQTGIEVPKNTVLGKMIAGMGTGALESIPHYAWTNNECRSLDELYEEAILTPGLSQGLSILWAEEITERDYPSDETRSADDGLLEELDGHLRFEKRIRKR
jgi:IrrE N-terminal-like domain